MKPRELESKLTPLAEILQRLIPGESVTISRKPESLKVALQHIGASDRMEICEMSIDAGVVLSDRPDIDSVLNEAYEMLQRRADAVSYTHLTLPTTPYV